MGRRNPQQVIFDRVDDNYKGQMVRTKALNTVPLGYEELSPREARAKYKAMPAEEKQRMIETGQQALLLQMARGGGGNV